LCIKHIGHHVVQKRRGNIVNFRVGIPNGNMSCFVGPKILEKVESAIDLHAHKLLFFGSWLNSVFKVLFSVGNGLGYRNYTSVFVVVYPCAVEYEVSRPHWPWHLLLAVTESLDVCDLGFPLKIVKLRHEGVEDLNVVVASDCLLHACLHDTVGDDTSVGFTFFLLVEGPFVVLIVVLLPAVLFL